MYRIAILDDSTQDGAKIASMIGAAMRRRGLCCETDVFDEPEQLLRALEEQAFSYDLLVLDILLDGKNGVELARFLRQREDRTKIIFVTVSPDFAIEGYKVQAEDYLLKPVDPRELQAALERIFPDEDSFLIHSSRGLRLLAVDSIQYIEILGHYLQIYTDSGDISLRGTLAELEVKLPEGRFIRCHRSYLVNISRIQEAGGGRLVLKNGKELPVSRRYAAAIQEALVDYVEKNISFF